MAARKPTKKKDQPRPVRKTVTLDAVKLEQARRALGVDSDAEVIRLALDHLLSHFDHGPVEEE